MPKEDTQWKPGQSGNPAGGRKVDPDMVQLKQLTNKEIKEVGYLLINSTTEQLQALAKDPNASVLKVLITSVIGKAIQRGDATAMNVIMDRLAGKVKQTIEHQGSIGPTPEDKKKMMEALQDPSIKDQAIDLAEKLSSLMCEE